MISLKRYNPASNQTRDLDSIKYCFFFHFTLTSILYFLYMYTNIRRAKQFSFTVIKLSMSLLKKAQYIVDFKSV